MGKFKDQLKDVDLDGKEVKHIEAIILSMTPEERANVKILNGSRRKRIADGAGVNPGRQPYDEAIPGNAENHEENEE